MSDAQEYLLAIDKNQQEAAHIAKEVANRIERKETKLVEVVQSVGEYLTDDDATIRARAVAYLGAVLGSLDAKALTRQHGIPTRVLSFLSCTDTTSRRYTPVLLRSNR